VFSRVAFGVVPARHTLPADRDHLMALEHTERRAGVWDRISRSVFIVHDRVAVYGDHSRVGRWRRDQGILCRYARAQAASPRVHHDSDGPVPGTFEPADPGSVGGGLE